MSKQSAPRMTLSTELVLRTLLEKPTEEMYGQQICTVAGLPSGTIHPILARLEGLHWVESRWEDDASAHAEGHPRTEDGAERARIALAQATRAARALAWLRTRPEGGMA
jgi:PadR family transcriptional regulator, regulatory protein PadR